jgi:hypothetical protein
MDLWPQKRDPVRNDDIRERLGVTPINEKLMQHRLRCLDISKGGLHVRPVMKGATEEYQT